MRMISPHFSLDEFCVSRAAVRHGLDNTPSPEAVARLQSLCEHLLEPLRVILDMPVKITSGYRCSAVNIAVGGAPGSQHTRGEAADIHVPGLSLDDLYEIIRARCDYDQCIRESGWVHVSWTDRHPLRRQSWRWDEEKRA